MAYWNFEHFQYLIKVTHQRVLWYGRSQLQFDLQIFTFIHNSSIPLFALNQTVECFKANRLMLFFFDPTISSVHSSRFKDTQNWVLRQIRLIQLISTLFLAFDIQTVTQSWWILIGFHFKQRRNFSDTEIPWLPWKYKFTNLLNNIQRDYRTNITLYLREGK